MDRTNQNFGGLQSLKNPGFLAAHTAWQAASLQLSKGSK
jgi:hypothetical protein